MGIAMSFQSISDEWIELLLEYPQLIERIFGMVAEDEPLPLRTERKQSIWCRLFERRHEPTAPPPPLPPIKPGEGEETDIDKSWEAMHLLLAGGKDIANPPFDFLIHGGTSLPEQESGDWCVQLMRSEEVESLSQALQPITDETLHDRYDGKAMMDADIYPNLDWTDLENADYPIRYFASLKTFIHECASHHLGMLVHAE